MGKREEVYTGKGVGYYGSKEIYVDNQKVSSEAHRITLGGKKFVDVYDKNNNKIDSYYTDDDDD